MEVKENTGEDTKTEKVEVDEVRKITLKEVQTFLENFQF
jgi:hypothetical protein